MKENSGLPNISTLQQSILSALRDLGAAASNEQLKQIVVETLGITPERLAVLHDPSRGSRSELEYRMAWARTKLKALGLIENVDHKLWRLCGAPGQK